MIKQILFCTMFLSYCCCFAQDKKVESLGGEAYQQKYQLKIHKATQPIKLDGLHNEPDWQTADMATNFAPHWPQDNVPLKRNTEVKVTFDDKFLYVAAICRDTSYHILQTLKRDATLWDSDAFMVFLDPVNQRTNGFVFSVSPANVQFEDLLTGDSFDEPSGSWDNKWFSETKVYKDYWAVEIAIPFKTLRFDPAKLQWGVNFMRCDLKNNQYSTWTFIPVNFNGYDFGYTGSIVWEQRPPSVRGNASIVPYITGGLSQSDGVQGGRFSGGLDAKLSITPSMNLDLTVNPDFSQIEVDRQVTNLTRFNIFFPERRTFFLENADLFGGFGLPPIRPFFSRTIGLDNSGQTVPIVAGARLSGNLNKTLRVGLMNMQTSAKNGNVAQNFSAVTFQQRILARSSIKGYFLNKQGFLDDTQKRNTPFDAYGRNQGLEFNYSNQSGTISAWTGHHFSQKPTINGQNSFHQLGAMYSGRNLTVLLDLDQIGTNYYADMGFVNRIDNYTYVLDKQGKILRDTSIRLGYKMVYNEVTYTIRPKSEKINAHELYLQNWVVWNPNGSLNEYSNEFKYTLMFKNASEVRASYAFNNTQVLFPFLFTDSEYPLPIGNYKYGQWKVRYNSDYRKAFFYSIGLQAGQFYSGTLQQYLFEMNYRAQPWGNFGLNFEQNDIKLPGRYGSDRLLLISPRVEINFSNNLFWTTFLQYNTQRNNFNINSRLQWRYKPMSDFFLVYTDNYFTDSLFKNKSRGVVFKLNYWLSL